jgi:Holliday junction resolvase
MSTKSKGTNAERELIHKFWASGYAAVRVAGSGSMKYPSPDIIASKGSRVIVLECKVTKDQSKYLEKEEISDLKTFACFFNAEAFVAVKFNGIGWFFLKTELLQETDKSYMVDVDLAEKKGIKFENLI